MLPQLVTAGLLPAAAATSVVGTIDPQESVNLQRTYLRTFFDAAFASQNITAAIAEITPPQG